MSEIDIEGIKIVPCFDKDVYSVGTAVHVMEKNDKTDEMIESFGLIRNVGLDELVILYIEDRNTKKEKRVSIDSILNNDISIEIVVPQKQDLRKELLMKDKGFTLSLDKIL